MLNCNTSLYAAINKNEEISTNWFLKDTKHKKKCKRVSMVWYIFIEDKKEYKKIYIYISAHSGKKNEEAETHYQLGCLPTRDDGKGWGAGGKGDG